LASTDTNPAMSVETYNSLPGVMPRLLAPSLVLAAAFLYLGYHFSLFEPAASETGHSRAERIMYTTYFAFFVAMWGMYFLSRWAPKGEEVQGKWFFRILRIRTLRRLLIETTENWGDLISGYVRDARAEAAAGGESPPSVKRISEEAELARFEQQFKDKSNSSLQNLGMLAGAAALELSQIASIHHWHIEETRWSLTTLGVGALASITALVCFIIAADSLDSLFNRFRNKEERHVLIRFFYLKSVNPRYFGLMSLLVGAVMLVADISPCLGSVSLAIICTVGYPHWFPSGVKPDVNQSLRPKPRVVLSILGILVPLYPHFH
jgi:protein-S-isoprenylcysteine O-methyltransferase Ste14